MPAKITINDITGTTPFDIYVCDNPITTCIYIDTISTLPFEFNIPSIMENQDDYNLKVIDNDNCITFLTLTP